jgi:preprotein translocase subunit SecA
MFTLITNPFNSIKTFLLERKYKTMSVKENKEFETWKEQFTMRANNHFQLFMGVTDPKQLQFLLSVFLYSTDHKWIMHMVEELGEEGATEWVANTLGVDKAILGKN